MCGIEAGKVDPIIGIRDLSVKFRLPRRKVLTAVSNATLHLRDGETLGLIGESGSGKSTLARALVGLAPLSGGEVLFEGRALSKMNRLDRRRYTESVQMVFQDPHSALDPRRTVLQSVREPLDIRRSGTSISREKAAREALDQVGLSSMLLNKHPHQISGGQKQRVNIARALITNPRVLILDESVAALDVAVQAEILNLLAELKESLNLSMLFISHDLSVVAHVADRVAVMYLGEVVEVSTTNRLMSETQHPYTEAIIGAEPKIDAFLREDSGLPILHGDIPSPISPPPGCRFHTRCPKATEMCASVVPNLVQVEDDHWSSCLQVSELYPVTSDRGAC